MRAFESVVFLCLTIGWLAGSASAVNIGTVPVGDPGNTPDTSYGTPGFGGVAYTYSIAKYEVTAGQYTAFLNAVGRVDTYELYNTNMSRTDYGSGITRSTDGSYRVGSNFVDRPVNYVSIWDAFRFANWLHNGQPTGVQSASTTEDGVYTLHGQSGQANDDGTTSRKPAARWALASEDEWYKAAYYRGGSTNAGYWTYPTRSNTAPGQDLADASGNNANYYTAPRVYPIDSGKYTTVVGQFQNSAGPYGTFDQGGNLEEWNENITFKSAGDGRRGVRGGSYQSQVTLSADCRNFAEVYESSHTGFRVVQLPEPATVVMLSLVGIVSLRRRW